MIEDFLQRLEKLIRNEGYSIRTFEIHCGISNGTISRAIRNNKQFQIDVLLKIADKFPHWDLDALIRGGDNRSRVATVEEGAKTLVTNQLLLDRIIELGELSKALKNQKS